MVLMVLSNIPRNFRVFNGFKVPEKILRDVEKVKTEPEEVEDKEFTEDKKALVPFHLGIDHSMLY
jgi:hypothetical protein